MDASPPEKSANPSSPIYVVSGGEGTSGQQIVETVLVQFPGCRVPLLNMPHVRRAEQVEDIVSKASATGGTIVHTLVDEDLRSYLLRLGKEKGVIAIDLMGELLDHLAEVLGQKPAGMPGLYRQMHRDYFDRVEAIEFAMTHDDGRKIDDLTAADIVIIGLSRSGKTPLSMYLAVLGWKVANIPLIPGQPLPRELYEIDRSRVIGLRIELERLILHRKKRQARMGVSGPSPYTDPAAVFKEVQTANKVYQRGGFLVIDVTNKPIESNADEVIDLISRRFKKKPEDSQ